MSKHNNLFFLCENCAHPVILSEEQERGVLPTTNAIGCDRCEYEHRNIKELKEYAKYTRNYAKY